MQTDKIFAVTAGLSVVVWVFSAIDQQSALSRKDSSQKTDVQESVLSQESLGLDKERWIDERFAKMLVDAKNPLVQAQVDEVDRQIAELEKMKLGFESRARRHDDQAQRLQFEDRAVLETRRHNQLAEENRLKAQKVQEEIDRLRIERQKLLQ